MSMPASKRTTKKGKFIELARKKHFKKRRRLFTYALNEKEADAPKKRGCLFFEKVLK